MGLCADDVAITALMKTLLYESLLRAGIQEPTVLALECNLVVLGLNVGMVGCCNYQRQEEPH